MPLPTPNGEPKEEFISSCMINETMKSEFPDEKQRYAVCLNSYEAKNRAYNTEDIIHAISSQILGDDLPEDIQYLPPGEHDITATKNNKPAELTLTVTAQTAEKLQKSFDKITAGDREQIFIDFNHDDKEASGWVTGFYWAGDDPEQGGVRAKVEWTSQGKQALEGRNYRKFSPTFTLNAKGEIDGTTLNAGGLVNRPAFKDITPIVASEGDYHKTESQMTEEDKEKKPIASQEEEPKKKEETTATDKLAEKDEEIKSLKDKVKALEDEKKKEQEVAAQSSVDKAVEDGRIAPKDEKVKAKWVSILQNDPSAVMALNALPVNPAFQRVVQAKREEGGSIVPNSDAQMRAAKEYQARNGNCSFEQAWEATRYDNPQLFN